MTLTLLTKKLSIRKHEIEHLLEEPEKLNHTWGKERTKSPKDLQNSEATIPPQNTPVDKDNNGDTDMADLQRLADRHGIWHKLYTDKIIE